MRIRYIVIPVVILLAVAGLVLAFLASNVDKYRPRIQSELQAKLGRPVTLGPLGLKLFPLSVRAEGLTIGDAPQFSTGKPFATAKELFVSVGLFSLLGGSPEVKRVNLQQPQIELIRNAAGIWNFSTIGAGDGAGASSSRGSGSSQFSLDELQITDGQVAITDQAASQSRSVYDHIDLNLTGFAPGKQFGIELGVHFPGQGKQLLAFKGKAGPLAAGHTADLPLNGHLSLAEVSLSGMNRFAAGTIPPGTDTVASGDADVSSQGTTLSAKGDLKLQNTVVHGAKLDFPISARYDLSDDRARDVIDVRSGSVTLGSTSFTASGQVNQGAKPASLNVHLTTRNSSITELAKLAGAFGLAFNPAYQVKGFVNADVTAQGAMSAPQLNGNLEAKQLEASGGEIKQPVSVPEVNLTLTPASIQSNSFTAQSGSTTVKAQIALSQYATPNIATDATLQTENANIAELLNIAKAYGINAAQGMSGTGKLSANVHVQGPLEQAGKLNYSGTGTISGATLNSPELAKPIVINSANAQFSQNSVAISGLAASLGTTSLQGHISARNFSAPDVQFALTADKIDTAELQGLMKAQPAGPKANAPAQKPATAPNQSAIDTMTGSGTLAANSVKAEDFNLANVRAAVKLDHGVITLSPLTSDIFGGKQSGSISIDVRPAAPLCSTQLKFAGVDSNALLSAVSSMKDTLYGSLAADANLRFTLVSANELARSLNGTLAFNVTNGQLKNVNILNELSKVGKFLGSAPGQSGSGTALRKFSGTLNIVNGLASTNNLNALLDAGSLAANGSMNLVSQGLDLHMTAALGSGTSQSVGGTHVGGFLNTALANNKGELVLPVLVTGTAAHPIFAPDVQALAKMKLNNLLPTAADPGKLASGLLGGKGGAGGLLNGVLGGTQAPGAAPNSNQPQPRDAVKSLLNQFGQKKKKQ